MSSYEYLLHFLALFLISGFLFLPLAFGELSRRLLLRASAFDGLLVVSVSVDVECLAELRSEYVGLHLTFNN